MHPILVDRDRRGREVGVCEGTDGDRYELVQTLKLIVDRRTAGRAEMELGSGTFIADALEHCRSARDGHIPARKPGLLPKDAARPALASQAVANEDAHGFT